jgi:hypothetical protein
MDTIMAVFTTIVSFTAVIMNDMGLIRIDPSVLGLTITLLLQLSMLFQYMIRQVSSHTCPQRHLFLYAGALIIHIIASYNFLTVCTGDKQHGISREN